MYRSAVFASSLLSLISPWARSRVVPCRTARAPRTPVPPTPPRRHSDPAAASHAMHARRRHSDTRHAHQGLDLRQELLQLNLSNRDVDKWLGGKFDETEEERLCEVDFRFEHDIPLQRTISLDRGIEIFNYLQKLSDPSDSPRSDLAVSFCTLSSDDGLALNRYRSFDDIPASPVKARSRHVSVDLTNADNSLAFSVLKDSYKGLDAESGLVTPQIRKLQKTFSFKSFDEYRGSAKSSTENLARVESEGHIGGIVMRQRPHVYRSISYESEDRKSDGNKTPRQRRHGVTSYENTQLLQPNLIHFKSCDDVFVHDNSEHSRLGSTGAMDKVVKFTFVEKKRDKYQSDPLRSIRKLRSSLLTRSKSECRELVVPKIVVTEDDSFKEIDVASIGKEENTLTETSNSVEIGRNCDCSICSGDGEELKESFLSRHLTKIFTRLVSYREYGRKFAYWDENNNLNENEMYSCFINILKLLLGLWLRHLDHKQHNLCA